MRESVFVGIDVAQDWLDVWLHPLGQHARFANTLTGVGELEQLLTSFKVEKIVVEATGGLEYLAAQHLQQAGLPVAVVNPHFTSAFRTMRGKYTKTDIIDAETMALFAQKMEPEVRPVLTAQNKEMKDLAARRRQLLSMIGAEQSRLTRVQSAVARRSIETILSALRQEKKEIDQHLQASIQNDESSGQKYQLLTSIPSIGPAIAMTLITELPELGQLGKKQMTSLAGLAPHNRESGRMKGKSTIKGGRQPVKAALYMAALVSLRYNLTFRGFYDRLVKNGKAKQVALTACMRKILVVANAMVKSQRPWQYDYQSQG